MTRIRIENVVASTSLSTALDLKAIAHTLDGAEYDPDQFPGLIYRLEDPKTAILLFSSGKAVCTGGKSWKQVDDTVRKVTDLIRRSGQRIVAHPKIQVQNIVATSNLGAEINLNSIAVTLGLDRVEYEPEQFPGLVCRLDEPRVVVLLFGSGKLVCTGARRPSDISLAVDKITAELQGAGLLPHERRAPSAASTKARRAPRSTAATPADSASPEASRRPLANVPITLSGTALRASE